MVADPRPEANDKSLDYVGVASASLIFKFHRWHRENYAIQVAPTFASAESYELLDALRFVDPHVEIDRPKIDTNWRYWAKLLWLWFQS